MIPDAYKCMNPHFPNFDKNEGTVVNSETFCEGDTKKPIM